MQPVVPERIGRYDVRRVAGSGGFATVYEGFDPRLDALVAIKVLGDTWSRDPEIVRRFRHEAVLLRRMRVEHGVPGLVEVFDIDQTELGQPFFVMGWADRGTLSERIGAEPWPFEAVKPVIEALTQTLGHLHSRGVVHRDIKPANLLVRSDGGSKPTAGSMLGAEERLLVGDLGLAKDFANELSGLSLVAGTPKYVAPEQLVFGGSIDQRADIFAASVMIREVLAGADGELAPALARVLDRGTAEVPGDRHGSMSEWQAALLAAAAVPTPVSPAPAVGFDQSSGPMGQAPLPIAGPPVSVAGRPVDVAGPAASVAGPLVDVAGPPVSVAGRPVDVAGPPGSVAGRPANSVAGAGQGRVRAALVAVLLVGLAVGSILGWRLLSSGTSLEIVGPSTIESGTTAVFGLADDVEGPIVWTDPAGQRLESRSLEVSGRLPGRLELSVRADGIEATREVAVEASPDGPMIIGPEVVTMGDSAVFTAAVPQGHDFYWIHPTRGQLVAAELTVEETGDDFVVGLISVDERGVERGDQRLVMSR